MRALYQNNRFREDLILAAYQHDIERLTTTADEVLARHSSAKAAFVEWFDTLAAYIRIKHGLGDALHSAAAQELISASGRRRNARATPHNLDSVMRNPFEESRSDDDHH